MTNSREYYDVVPTGDLYLVRRVDPANGFKAVVLQDNLTKDVAENFKGCLMDAYNDGADHAKDAIRERLLSMIGL